MASSNNLQDILTAIENKLDVELNQFTQDVASEVKTLRLQGLSDDAILARLVDEFTSKSGVFKILDSRMGTLTDFGINVSANLANGLTVRDTTASDLFEWSAEPTGQVCDTCSERDGQVNPFVDWEQIGLPGQFFRSGNVGTECGIYCRCALLPVST